MKILVTGGAGYIGSFMVRRLIERGDEVFIIDDLERGHKAFIDPRAKLLQGSVLDKKFLSEVFKNKFDGVIHFAGYISMGESVEKPYMYFENNTFGSLVLLEEMVNGGTKNIIFSSTAGVYGNPAETPITEDHPKLPTNPYGESKLMVERIMEWYNEIHDVNFTALRYFNAAGASLDGRFGEDHDPETHLIPRVMLSILKDEEFTLFGEDYDTPDGSCVRDYIHVLDLVEAHVLALDAMLLKSGAHFYNIGTGRGYSNRQVISEIERISGKKLKIKVVERRRGDADTLIADPKLIKADLRFDPKNSDLPTIIESAWKWHSEKLKG